ncbi:hypothetical protein L7F22_035760 [Adiantum nelumboides]|nr:hypothetical protein [Adiantum nelumboides]
MKCSLSIRGIDSVDDLYVHKVTIVGAHASKDDSSNRGVDAYMCKVNVNEVCEATLKTIHMLMVQNGKDIVDECKSLSTSMESEDDESEIDKDEATYDGDTFDPCESWCSDVCNDDDIESLDPLKDMVALHKEQHMFWEQALQQQSMDACNEDEMVGYGHGVSTLSEDDIGDNDAMMVDLTLGPCALPSLEVGQPCNGCDTKVLGHEGDRDMKVIGSGVVNAWSDGLLGVENEEQQSMHQEDNVGFMVVNQMDSSYEMHFEVFLGLADWNKVWYDMACANPREDSYHAWDLGWYDPVDLLSVYAYISKSEAKEAWVEKICKRDQEIPGSSKRATRSSNKKEEVPKPLPEVNMEDASKDNNQGKPTGPSYKLKSDIELATDLKKAFEERILNNKVEITLGDILGIAKREFHEETIDIIKRK